MRIIRTIILLVILLCTLPGLAKENKNQTLTVILDWFVNPDHAPLLVAAQHGFFEEQGIKVKLIAPADPSDGPKLVAAKQADVAIAYQPQLLLQIDQGLPLIRFGALVPTPLDCLVTLKANNIQKISDLKHRTIGYSSNAIDSAMLQVMLKKYNLTLSDVAFINIHYSLVQALLSGNIAAFTGGMRNIEPIQLEQAGYPPQVFYPEDNGFPSYEELIFVTHRDKINDPRLPAFLKAVQKGQQYLLAHPQDTWLEVIQKYPELDNALNKASWMASINYFAKNPENLDVGQYQKLAEFMQQQGMIKKAPATSSYAVQLFSD